MTNRDGTRIIPTTCRIEDGMDCRILAHVENGKVVKVEPGEFPTPGMRHICAKGLSSVKDILYHPDRLKYPMKRQGERGEGRWKRISWEEATGIIAEKLKEVSDKYGSKSIAFMPGQLWTAVMMGIYQRLASALQATWVNLSGFGDAAGPSADNLSYGIPIGNHYTNDVENPDLCVLWGGNYVETHPLVWRQLRDKKEKGARIIAVDPRFSITAAKADEYIPIRPGTDAALALGIIKIVVDNGLANESFLAKHTVGPFLVRKDTGMFLREKDLSSTVDGEKYMVWDTVTNSPRPHDASGALPALRGTYKTEDIECQPAFQLLVDLANDYPAEKVSEITDIPIDTVEKLAMAYGKSRSVASYRGWGAQRTYHGDLTWRAITALAAVTGNINLQGYRSFQLNREGYTTLGAQCYEYMHQLSMYEAIETGKPYPVKALWIAAYNPVNQNPDYNRFVKSVLPDVEFIVTVDMFMTTTAQHSDIVLPACSFYECMELCPPFDSHNTYLCLQDKVIEPLYESRSHIDIVNAVGTEMGFAQDFNFTEEEYAKLILSSKHPSMEGITLEKLRENPIDLPDYDVPLFLTPSGRIEFYSEAMIPFAQALPVYKEPLESNRRPLAKQYPLSLITGHSRYIKCSMLVNSPLMRSLDPGPKLEMNPKDAEDRGVVDGDLVKVFNDRGKVKLRCKLHQGIKPGSVNLNQGWWPELYEEGTHQELSHFVVNEAQKVAFEPNAALYDILVEVKKA